MHRRPPRSTRTAPLFPSPTLFRAHDPHLPARLVAGGSLKLGESYMDGWWDARSLDGFLYHPLDARIEERVPSPADIRAALRARLFNLQAGRRSYERSEEHTSELQSLMRISYAVFCLKKKKQT